MLIRSHTVVGRRPGPRLLITAGVHGDEWEPMVAVRQLFAETQSEDLSGRLTLVPIVNEPAYRRGSRTGDDGLDLARVCPGCPEGTITERIASELAELLRDADYFIDLHTGGVALRLWPLTGYMLHPDPQVLDKQRLMARAFDLPLVWGSDPTLQGRSLSVARDLAVPAIYAEYLGSAPFCDAAVGAYVTGCRNVMQSLHMLGPTPGAPFGKKVRYLVEDGSPGSGHLQVCHPAPADGLFRPVVELGDAIATGAPLGRLIVDHDATETVVCAERSGRVVALRSIARVNAGDSLGVVVQVAEV